MRNIFSAAAVSVIAALLLTAPLSWAAGSDSTQLLFKNVNVFDGKSDDLKMGVNVLIEGNLITKIGAGVSADAGAQIIDGSGKTLIPGLRKSVV